MTRVKICGITNLDDARAATEAGADLLGFIFYNQSKRYVVPGEAGQIIAALHSDYGDATPVTVGVMVVKDMTRREINEFCETSGIDAAQIVGAADASWLNNLHVPAFAAIRPETAIEAEEMALHFENRDLPAALPTLLVDAFHPTLYGGTGHVTATAVAQTLAQMAERLMLAGGLTPDNVGDYVAAVQPWAVDVASGTEAAPGLKDHQKVREFIAAAKQALSEDS